MLAGPTASIVSADVTLDSADPIVGSFTVDGLTYAVNDGGVTLISVAGPLAGPEGEGSAEGGFTNIPIPATVAYGGATYDVTAIGPYAFYLSGATDVALPASVTSVDSRAFRSSDVERVEIAADNPNIASFDGALYSADLSSLLLIPEGRAGAVLLPKQAEVVEASKFSHCSLVDAISVEEGGADFASWDGLLYDASGTTLLRVPAGTTDITIRDGCTAIAAGALEGCAKLERISAPASVTSISPDVFESVPTVTLPAQLALQDATNSGVASALADQVKESADSSGAEGEAEVSPRRVVAESQGLSAPLALPDLGSTSASPSSEASGSAPQLTAMVALSAADDDLPEVDPSSITVSLFEGADASPWQVAGFSSFTSTEKSAPAASIQAAGAYDATWDTYANPNGGALRISLIARSTAQEVPGSCSFSATPIRENGRDAWAIHGGADFQYYLNDVYTRDIQATRQGYHGTGVIFVRDGVTREFLPVGSPSLNGASPCWVDFCWAPNTYAISLDAQGGSVSSSSIAATYDQDATLPAPVRSGYKFLGWSTTADGSGTTYQPGTVRNLTDQNGAMVALYAQWERVDFDLGFDTDSEPGDADYPADSKADQAINSGDGQVPIEDPKRPGYVFEGWVIPTEDGTEAVDQDLVYQDEADGKWYVDASKLPDYAGDDGRVELTARWTAALSVDAPISATFMYDLSAWDGTETRDAYVEGSSTVKNRSAVPIRVGGIESAAGDAASVLKRSDGTTLADAPQGDAAKVLSVFPTTSAATGTEGDAKAPASDDVADDLAHKVDMALSDVKLEAAFDHGAWAVDAATVGDNGVTVSTGDLKLGYRLNLGSATGVTLDQDALLAVTGDPDTGAAKDAVIANLTYCFAAEGLIPTGSKSDPLWVEVTDPEVGSVGVYGVADIKRAADDFSSRVDPATDPNDQSAIYAQLAGSPYFELFRQLFDNAVPFHLKVGNNYVDTQVIGFCQDSKSDGTGKAGLTFSYKNVAEQRAMNPTESNAGGWNSTSLRAHLMGNVWPTVGGTDEAGAAFRSDYVEPVMKVWQLYGGSIAGPSAQTLFIPSYFEAFGVQDSYYGIRESNANSFQYMYYAKGGGAANTGSSVYRIKTLDGQPAHWWLRSAVGGIDGSFTHVGASSGTRNSSPANLVVYAGRKYGYTPCFAL